MRTLKTITPIEVMKLTFTNEKGETIPYAKIAFEDSAIVVRNGKEFSTNDVIEVSCVYELADKIEEDVEITLEVAAFIKRKDGKSILQFRFVGIV